MEMENPESKLPSRLLGISEVACFFGVHSSTVRRWQKKGLVESYVLGPGHNVRFMREDILNFLRKYREGKYREA